MTSQEIKSITWQHRRDHLQGFRETVWKGLSFARLYHQRPVTTREVATMLHLDVLMVRPRITELVQLGFARCAKKQGHEGLYEPISLQESQANFERQENAQKLLNL